jgi:GntR family transcriptional repressor for pyruvate dehydrogenase complex
MPTSQASPLTYRKIRPKPIFEQVIEEIRAQIVEGNLKPGASLPPERQLSEMIGVNRHSLREALKILEFIGVVKSRTRTGTIVRNAGQDAFVEQFSKLGDFSPRQFLVELMELRQLLEPGIAALAATRATKADLAVMRRAMEDFEKEFERGPLGSDADERLHVALANATHNSTLVRLTKPMMGFLAQYREKGLRLEGRRQQTFREHERIYVAVSRRNPDEARRAMEDHLAEVEKMVRKIEQRKAR